MSESLWSCDARPSDPVVDLEHHCITCGDDGVAMRIVAVDPDRGIALCEDAGGQRQSVETALVEPVAVGDALLVHAGTALTQLEDVGT